MLGWTYNINIYTYKGERSSSLVWGYPHYSVLTNHRYYGKAKLEETLPSPPPPPPPPPHPTYNESQLPHTHTKLPGYGIITVQIPNRSTISLSECVIIISIQVATDIIRHLEDKCLIRSYIASTNMHQTAVMLPLAVGHYFLVQTND